MASGTVSKSPTINKLKELGISLKSLSPFKQAFLKAQIADELGYRYPNSVALSYQVRAVKALLAMYEFDKATDQAVAYGLTDSQMDKIVASTALDRLLLSDLQSAKKMLDYFNMDVHGQLEELVQNAVAQMRSRNLHWNAHNLEYMAGIRSDLPPANWKGPRT